MGIKLKKDSLDLNFTPKLKGVKFRLNLPLNFTKLCFKFGNNFKEISINQKLNFRSSGLVFSLCPPVGGLNSKLNSKY